MIGWLLIVAIVALSFVGAVVVLFENDPPQPERMSGRWLARYNAAEHEDEEAR